MLCISLIKKGSQCDITEDDLWMLEESLLSKTLEEKLEKHWLKSSNK